MSVISQCLSKDASVKDFQLGTIGESFHEPKSKDPQIVAFRSLKVPKDKAPEESEQEKKDFQEARTYRYKVQDTLISLFTGKRTPKGASWGFHHCKRTPIKGENVDLVYSPSSGLAHYRGCQTCQKGRACPHCAETKAINDKELLEAMKNCHARTGGSVLLVTLTNQHNVGDKLSDLIEGQKSALTKLNKSLSNQDFFAEFGGRLAVVRAWEITYGKNGWHPHFHFLYYMADDLVERDDKGKVLEEQPNLTMIRNSLSEEWRRACISAGLKAPSLEHGVDVRDGSHADKYVGKYGDEIINMKGGWGSSDEMSKPHLKTDKKAPQSLAEVMVSDKGVTPWQLLKFAHEGCEKSGWLFVQYAYATYGTSQLYWYQGAKKLYDLKAEIKEMKAEQDLLLAKSSDDNVIPPDRLFMTIPPAMWKAVVFCGRRSELLIVAELDASNGDFEHKYNTMALINDCLKNFLEQLQNAKNDTDINAHIADKDIVKVNLLSNREKAIKKRYGSKSFADGLDLLAAIDKLEQQIFEPVPDWILDVPIIQEQEMQVFDDYYCANYI